MSIEKDLQARSDSKCELCLSIDNLSQYAVAPKTGNHSEECAYICDICSSQIDEKSEVDINHWRCLNDSMWNTNPAVQVLAWRMLTRLKAEGWPQGLLDMLYLDEETMAWAQVGEEDEVDIILHKDSNGATLSAGDSVVLIKDLNVKGANFTAKRGTAVRNISLVHDNPEHIEGKVNGQQIVILTKYVKK